MKPTQKTDEMNPYSGRQVRLLELELDRMQAEGDQFNNAPQNVVRAVWDRFVDFRRRRADLDRDVSRRFFFVSSCRSIVEKPKENEFD